MKLNGHGSIPPGGWKMHADPGHIMLGFEYEIDPQSQDSQNEVFNTKIIHEDYHWTWESLMSPVYGWEVKSFITSLRKHRDEVNKFLNNAKFNTNPNGQNTNAGGIHVNIGKDNFTKPLYPKVVKYLNLRVNEPHLLKLSRRTKATFDQYARRTGDGSEPSPWSKYEILAQHKANCFELRMFAAHPEILMGTLEYADALFQCAHDIKDDLTTDHLLHWTGNSPEHQEAHKLIHAAV